MIASRDILNLGCYSVFNDEFWNVVVYSKIDDNFLKLSLLWVTFINDLSTEGCETVFIDFK